MTLFLYRLLTDLAALPLRVVIRWRAWRGKEDPQRLGERRGITDEPRADGALVWFHAASIGESVALLPLIHRFCETTANRVLLTTGTVTSARLMADRLPAGALHQFAPWDRSAWVTRFLDHWHPDLAVRMESEIWPNTILLLKDRNIPLAVINARLSASSVRGWSRAPSLARKVFAAFDLVIAQSQTFAAAFEHLGAAKVEVSPNIKLSAAPLPVDPTSLTHLKDAVKMRPIWLAASTHPGEEKIALAVHKTVAQDVPDLLTIIVPRHPERGDTIADMIRADGTTVAQRSGNQSLDDSTEIYIADTLGELGLFYTVAPVIFVGKSLSNSGGQNPIEAAHFGCAILFGGHMENFQDIAESMLTYEMALQVSDQDALAESVKTLLTDDVRRGVLSASAKTLVQSGSESVEQTFSALQDVMGRHGR